MISSDIERYDSVLLMQSIISRSMRCVEVKFPSFAVAACGRRFDWIERRPTLFWCWILRTLCGTCHTVTHFAIHRAAVQETIARAPDRPLCRRIRQRNIATKVISMNLRFWKSSDLFYHFQDAKWIDNNDRAKWYNLKALIETVVSAVLRSLNCAFLPHSASAAADALTLKRSLFVAKCAPVMSTIFVASVRSLLAPLP